MVVNLNLKLTPRSARNEVRGWASSQRDLLLVRVSAPPESGKANAALLDSLAKSLGIAKSRISLKRGHAARLKTVCLDMDVGDFEIWAKAQGVVGEE
jgi:uncharacterized protein YggU (UPF0235/DUF167 family)